MKICKLASVISCAVLKVSKNLSVERSDYLCSQDSIIRPLHEDLIKKVRKNEIFLTIPEGLL